MLEYVSATASAPPCGFRLPGHPDDTAEELCIRYAVKTSVYHLAYDIDGPTVVGGAEVPEHEDGETTRTHVLTKSLTEGACGTSYTATDVEHYYSLITLGDGRKYPEITFTASATSSSTSACSGTATTTTTYESDPPDPGDTETSPGEAYCYASEEFPDSTWTKSGTTYTKTAEVGPPEGDTGFYTITRTVSYSSPVTVPPVEMPDFPAFLSDSSEDLTPGQGRMDEAKFLKSCPDITHQKIKYRVKHSPTGTCYLKVWIKKTFQAVTPDPDPLPDPPPDPLPPPPEPPPPIITESTYEWEGTGNPCLTVPAEPITSEANQILGATTVIGVPTDEGITTVEILKFSCVAGYEPDISDPENPQPNGYPDPTWEASPP